MTTLRLDAAHADFRRRLCQFLAEELASERAENGRDITYDRGIGQAYRAEFRRALAGAGFVGMGWPVEYGGQGLDMVYEAIFADELGFHDAPMEPALTFIPHVIIACGTDQQKKLLLPRLRRGEISVLLGYTEPEAGSDLGNLSTAAVRRGDGFVITGQKCFTSYANAEWGIVATRTSTEGSKYRGITLFLVDMSSPGVEVTWHITVGGWQHGQVYFREVFVPQQNVLGEVDKGWATLMEAISIERMWMSGYCGVADMELDRMIQFSCECREGGERLIDDPVVRDDIVTLTVETTAGRLYCYETLSKGKDAPGQDFRSAAAALMNTTAVRRSLLSAEALMGPAAQLGRGSPAAAFGGDLEHDLREYVKFRFAAGGFDVSRNVIAQRGLQAPRA